MSGEWSGSLACAHTYLRLDNFLHKLIYFFIFHMLTWLALVAYLVLGLKYLCFLHK